MPEIEYPNDPSEFNVWKLGDRVYFPGRKTTRHDYLYRYEYDPSGSRQVKTIQQPISVMEPRGPVGTVIGLDGPMVYLRHADDTVTKRYCGELVRDDGRFHAPLNF